MDINYCLIVYMSYSDTQKVPKCCIYEKKSMLKKKEKEKREQHRVLSTSTCDIVLCFWWFFLSSCVPYVSSFSGLSIVFVLPFVFSNVYLSCVLCTLCFQFLWIVYCFFYCPLVFSNVYLSCVLCTLCFQFLWIVYCFFIALRYSLTFICPVSCVPYVASFSGLSFFFAPSVFSNVYLPCVLYTLCCQFLWIVNFFYCPFGIL